MNLWQNLLRFWPVTFADSLVTPAGALQAHAGTHTCLVYVIGTTHQQPSACACRPQCETLETPGFQVDAGMAEMANELYKQLQPHIQRAKDMGQTICFAGHSLGGALATLVFCLALLHQKLPPNQVQCATFGSPPVLAHRDGKNGDEILQVRPSKAAPLLILPPMLFCVMGRDSRGTLGSSVSPYSL